MPWGADSEVYLEASVCRDSYSLKAVSKGAAIMLRLRRERREIRSVLASGVVR